MLEKSKFEGFFSLSSKSFIKYWRQLTILATCLAQELLTNKQCRGGSRSFIKETRALKMRSAVIGHHKLSTTNWEDDWSWSSHNYMKSCQKKLTVNHSIIIQHLKQIGKLKKPYKWVPHELTAIQRNCHFEVSCSLIVCSNNVPFIDWIVACHEKWILSNNQQLTAQLLDQEEAPKPFPKPNLHSKSSWSLFDGLLPNWSTIAFWILAKPLHLRSMLSKLMKSTENCNDCSWHWSTERAQLYSTTMTNYVSHNQHCRSWTNLAMKFCLIHHIHLISRQPFLQMSFNNFLQESHLHNQQEAENAFQEFTESWSTNFYATWINKLTSCWQKCVDFNGSYFD